MHSAPEPTVQEWLRSISSSYLSIDFDGSKAMQRMDLTQLPLADASYTLVYCSHILEHIPKDRAAMSEIRRVLKPGSRAVVQVPIRGETTDEDLTVIDPTERLARYTQTDHVRFYGLDIVDRLTTCGFKVETFYAEELPRDLVRRQALAYPTTRHVFLCTAA